MGDRRAAHAEHLVERLADPDSGPVPLHQEEADPGVHTGGTGCDSGIPGMAERIGRQLTPPNWQWRVVKPGRSGQSVISRRGYFLPRRAPSRSSAQVRAAVVLGNPIVEVPRTTA